MPRARQARLCTEPVEVVGLALRDSMPLANSACGEWGSGVTPPVRCQCLGTRARTFAIGAAADGAVERTRTSIDAARLLAAAAVAIMTPSKRPSVTIDCVGLGHAATTEVHRKSLAGWVLPPIW